MKAGDGLLSVGHPTVDVVLAQHQAELYRFAVHLTRDLDQANDLFQQTMRTARRTFDGLDRLANYRSWLFTVATDAFLSDSRRCGRRSSPGEEQAAEIRATAPVPSDRLDAHSLPRVVESFVATLPCQQWAALVQRRYLNRAYAEIAETLSCSEEAARASVYGAVRAMRAHIGTRL